MRWRSVPILCVLIAAASPAKAQQLQPGTRVRGVASDQPFEGQVAWLQADSIGIVRYGETRVVDRAGITRLDVVSGSRSNTLRGLAIGAGVGAFGGLVVISLKDDNAPPSELEGLQYGIAGMVFVVATAAGGLIGTFVKSPRWVQVVPAGVGVSIEF
jgi:hypothetical protein